MKTRDILEVIFLSLVEAYIIMWFSSQYKNSTDLVVPMWANIGYVKRLPVLLANHHAKVDPN